MDAHSRARTALRYRFASMAQARAHVHAVEGRQLFFYRDEMLRLLPYAPVSIEWAFANREPSRLVHGWVVGSVEGRGTWVELVDTRPLRDVAPTEYTRRAARLGCDLLVRMTCAARVVTARMLDVSSGGARIGGVEGGLPVRQRIALELLAPDRVTFRPLGHAFVVWSDKAEVGLQFDRLEAPTRTAVSRLVERVQDVWARAWDAFHPDFCCGAGGVVDPEPPRLRPPQEPPASNVG